MVVAAAVGVMALATLLSLEIALRAAQAAGVFQTQERVVADPFYQDSNPRWGVWHPPNATFHARADCFEQIYESNSVGARDRERSLRSAAPRVLVLGDSFVEGVGAAAGERMTDLLEAKTGIEHLNFGTAANFSSLQEWLLYEDLARRFDHDLVLLFAFPNNDFLENDRERWWQGDRYRPYLRGARGRYEIVYPTSFEEAQRAAARQLRWNRVYNALFVYRLASWLDDQIRARIAWSKGPTTELGYVGYVNYDEADLDRLFYTYRKLRDAAAGRELVIFTLPRLHELEYAKRHDVSGALPARLAAFAEAEPRIRYVDLLPHFLAAERTGRPLGDYFIPCDGHWSALGNALAAEAVMQHVDYAALAESPPQLAAP